MLAQPRYPVDYLFREDPSRSITRLQRLEAQIKIQSPCTPAEAGESYATRALCFHLRSISLIALQRER
jgi:hypothetical protein